MKLPGEWDCPVEEQYETPPGFYDQFYIYAFDGIQANPALLTLPVNGLQVALDGDSEFLLRRVVGASRLNTAAPFGLQVYDAVKRRFWSQPVDTAPNYALDIAMAPEKVYPRAGQIWFDLASFNPLTRLSGATPGASIIIGQIAFQGVKRFAGSLEKPTFKYREKPFSYRLPGILVNWNAYQWVGITPVTPANPRQFTVVVDDYDFELLDMQLFDSATGLYPAALDPPIAVTLYNKSQIALYRRPVLSTYVFSNSAGPAAGTYYSRMSPGVVYPAGSIIKVDVHSLLLAADIAVPPTYEIVFNGVRRVPV